MTPCNWDDLDYYETCLRGYPPGVREWRERLYAHHRSIGLLLWTEENSGTRELSGLHSRVCVRQSVRRT